jgi:hypothetical protein
MAGTITESRLKSGTLSLGTTTPKNFECQATNVRLTPDSSIDTSDDDTIETLCGAVTTASSDTTVTVNWELNIDAIQDFDSPTGFVQYCFDNAGTVQGFSWKPSANSPTYSGEVRILPVEIGGDVAKRLTTSASFPVVGKPTITPKP